MSFARDAGLRGLVDSFQQDTLFASLRYLREYGSQPQCCVGEYHEIRLQAGLLSWMLSLPSAEGRHTEFGTITSNLSCSCMPRLCLRPQAHLAACSRRPPYVKLLFAIVSIWTTLSAGTLSGLYIVIRIGTVMLSSSPRGQNRPVMLGASIIDTATNDQILGTPYTHQSAVAWRTLRS